MHALDTYTNIHTYTHTHTYIYIYIYSPAITTLRKKLNMQVSATSLLFSY